MLGDRIAFLALLAGLAGGPVAAQAQPAGMDRSPSGAPVLRLAGSGLGAGVVYRSANLAEWVPYYDFAGSGVNLAIPADLGDSGDFGFFRVEFGSLVVPDDLVWIPPGRFRMGSPVSEFDRLEDEGPVFDVTIPRGFWMGRTEVTVREYVGLMRVNPSMSPDDALCPVENLTWEEAVEYCRRRTAHEAAAGRIPPGTVYRLPTEAEWEYAARAGTSTRASHGDDPYYTELGRYGWFGLNASQRTHPVAEKWPNPWGLHDIYGNVFEWCQDAYAPYPDGIPLAPKKAHVHRGGSWYCPASVLRSAARHPSTLDRSSYIGMRVVLGSEADAVGLDLPQVAAPVPGFVWSTDRTSVSVSATSATEGASVHYTVGGGHPRLKNSVLPVTMNEPGTIRAAGYRDGHHRSMTVVIPVSRWPVPTLEKLADGVRVTTGAAGCGLDVSRDGGAWERHGESVTVMLVFGSGAWIRARTTAEGSLTSTFVEWRD